MTLHHVNSYLPNSILKNFYLVLSILFESVLRRNVRNKIFLFLKLFQNTITSSHEDSLSRLLQSCLASFVCKCSETVWETLTSLLGIITDRIILDVSWKPKKRVHHTHMFFRQGLLNFIQWKSQWKRHWEDTQNYSQAFYLQSKFQAISFVSNVQRKR